MDSAFQIALTADQAAEIDKSFEFLLKLVDLPQADILASWGPATVDTTSVVLWMLVYQRMKKGLRSRRRSGTCSTPPPSCVRQPCLPNACVSPVFGPAVSSF